jgi:hypothetical protein
MYVFSRFGILYQEKSGNPDSEADFCDNVLLIFVRLVVDISPCLFIYLLITSFVMLST